MRRLDPKLKDDRMRTIQKWFDENANYSPQEALSNPAHSFRKGVTLRMIGGNGDLQRSSICTFILLDVSHEVSHVLFYHDSSRGPFSGMRGAGPISEN